MLSLKVSPVLPVVYIFLLMILCLSYRYSLISSAPYVISTGQGAPSYHRKFVRDCLDRIFRNRWIRRTDSVARPTRSPDFSSVYLSLWCGNRKSLLYDSTANSKMDLMGRIFIAAATTRETPGIFDHVHQSCQVGVMRVCLPMTAILDTFYDTFMSYFLFINATCVMKPFLLYLVLWFLQYLSLFSPLEVCFCPC